MNLPFADQVLRTSLPLDSEDNDHHFNQFIELVLRRTYTAPIYKLFQALSMLYTVNLNNLISTRFCQGF